MLDWLRPGSAACDPWSTACGPCAVQELQALVGPTSKLELMDLYEFCGHDLTALGHLEAKLREFGGDTETDCAALRLAVAAAKELHSTQVGGGSTVMRWKPACATVPAQYLSAPSAALYNSAGGPDILLSL
jgi:hypothetical protein